MNFAARRRASPPACAALLFILLAVSPAATPQQAAKGEIKPAAGAPASAADAPVAKKPPSSQASEKVKVRKARAAKPPVKPAAKEVAAKPGTYEVKKGDTLFAIARRTRHEGVTLNQMIVALYRANPEAFLGGNINQLRLGHILTVPGKEDVAALNAAEAARTVRSLIAKKPALPPTPEVKEAPPVKPLVKPPPEPALRLSGEEAERRYREGLAMERRGDERGALRAFLEAGESGHGLAQKKLGEIYDKGNSAVERDYETSIRWYQKAREQGVELPKPFAFPAGR